MPSIWKRFSSPKTEPYQFLETDELEPVDETLQDETPAPETEPLEAFVPDEEPEPDSELEAGNAPLRYAQIQADEILRGPRRTRPDSVKKRVRRAGRQAMQTASSTVPRRRWKRAGKTGRKNFPRWKPA